MNWFKSLLKNIWKRIIGDDENGKNIFEELIELAIPTIEALLRADLNGDNKIAARAEILEAAEQLGLKRLMRVLDPTVFEGLDISDLKRYLAIARTAKSIAASLGADSVPMFRVLSLIVEAAYNLVTANDVRVNLQSKGLL